ncbi:hypothetical protein F8M41_011202 [Gigaspora margarita]|uniref:F-box domain-containing protein n=1 Tax=Gigaspora margarita TaxID=4874 RepID=A0A8H4B443_GIGMA|nr:hypothetical protein F8M41_011202 [Gigaspora margarita]
MASKIFAGDMPELMERILHNLDSENSEVDQVDHGITSLFSCTLVNRYWCKMSIPILWQNPFEIYETPTFIPAYFSSLYESEKLLLKEYGIMTDFPNTLFQYERFLKFLNLGSLDHVIHEWIMLQFPNQQEDTTELECHIFNLLLRIFIEGGATLSMLELDFYNEVRPEIFYLLGRNKHFFSQLNKLTIVDAINESRFEIAISWLKILEKSSTKIRNLTFNCYYGYTSRLSHAYIRVISSQKQLKLFSFIGDKDFSTEFFGIISALESQKSTLKEIEIRKCAYSAEFETLRNCENLEVIRILEPYNENVFKTFNTKCCNTLQISSHKSIDSSNIIQILEKSGSSLQRLEIKSFRKEINSQSLLLKTLMTTCPNITYLFFDGIKLSVQFLEFIGGLKRLQFLTLDWMSDESEELMKVHIMNFAKILPSTLQYLSLLNHPSNLHIDILLNHCDAPLKKLLFGIIYKNNTYENKIKALIEFCLRKKTLEYVDIIDFVNEGSMLSFKNWNVIQKDLEEYVKLVPYKSLQVYC